MARKQGLDQQTSVYIQPISYRIERGHVLTEIERRRSWRRGQDTSWPFGMMKTFNGSKDQDESLTDANFGCRSRLGPEIEIWRGENIEAGAFSYTSLNSDMGLLIPF
jgi:hypothetical protein